MNDYERNEIGSIPDKYRPIGAWGYFGYQILFMIPLVGVICLIIFALSNANINRRNFARSYFCVYVIIIVAVIIIVFAGEGCAALSGIIK